MCKINQVYWCGISNVINKGSLLYVHGYLFETLYKYDFLIYIYIYIFLIKVFSTKSKRYLLCKTNKILVIGIHVRELAVY